MGSCKRGFRVPLRVLWGSIGFRVCWRFMGSCNKGVISRVTILLSHTSGLITLFIATHAQGLERKVPYQGFKESFRILFWGI